MRRVDIYLKNNTSLYLVSDDTETLDSLINDWKSKVSKITRYKGKQSMYLWLVPNQIVAIETVESTDES